MTNRTLDPVVLDIVERALDPYRALLTAELLGVFREELTDALTDHPVGDALSSRLRERPVQERSGDVETRARETVSSAPGGAPNAGAGGRRR